MPKPATGQGSQLHRLKFVKQGWEGWNGSKYTTPPAGAVKTLVTEMRFTAKGGWMKNPSYGLGVKIFSALAIIGFANSAAYAASDEFTSDMHNISEAFQKAHNNTHQEFNSLDRLQVKALLFAMLDKLGVPPLVQIKIYKDMVEDLSQP